MMGKSRLTSPVWLYDETDFLGTSDVADKLAKRLEKKIQFHLDEIINYEEFMVEDAEILLIAYGSTSRSARQAVRMARVDGIKVGLFRPITIWPFPNARLKKLISKVDAVLVAELNMGQIYKEVSQLNKKGKPWNLINRKWM